MNTLRLCAIFSMISATQRTAFTAFECRRRDGFFPHSHNKGGIEGIAYRDQYSACENTGFENTDAVLVKGTEYDIQWFAEENKLDANAYSDWT
jgi:hypothetical protein